MVGGRAGRDALPRCQGSWADPLAPVTACRPAPHSVGGPARGHCQTVVKERAELGPGRTVVVPVFGAKHPSREAGRHDRGSANAHRIKGRAWRRARAAPELPVVAGWDRGAPDRAPRGVVGAPPLSYLPSGFPRPGPAIWRRPMRTPGTVSRATRGQTSGHPSRQPSPRTQGVSAHAETDVVSNVVKAAGPADEAEQHTAWDVTRSGSDDEEWESSPSVARFGRNCPPPHPSWKVAAGVDQRRVACARQRLSHAGMSAGCGLRIRLTPALRGRRPVGRRPARGRCGDSVVAASRETRRHSRVEPAWCRPRVAGHRAR